MTEYTITVNGKSYDVMVQKKTEKTPDAKSAVNVVQTTAMPLASAPAAVSAKSAAIKEVESENVVAPMPGKIIEMMVRVGDPVKQGQALLIMEAMKMHNPILAAKNGIVGQLFVKVNDSVQSGQSLVAIR